MSRLGERDNSGVRRVKDRQTLIHHGEPSMRKCSSLELRCAGRQGALLGAEIVTHRNVIRCLGDHVSDHVPHWHRAGGC